MSQPHSNQGEILAELGYKPRPVFNGRHPAGLRSDGLPYASRCKVSDAKRAERARTRRIEDMALAKELGISLNELHEGAV
ncbi:hypothetical protein [Shewanella sp. SM74]|uniref:hypothetical protein n=1 Tax=Shewanella sp. SM74 TaxID=2912807 RepID=UPI0021D80946|nr:hypothetical protein [Shewanella sp. SM74]MCU8013660.1 hypothetical protein [Shewanella sp. SM74]